MVEHNGFLTLPKTAQLLRTTEINVLMHVRKGLLEQVEMDGLWYITIGSFEEFVSHNGIRKAAAVCSAGCGRHADCASSCG
ncbi:MAG: hypothetical protein C0623_06415 [Desulfuromonas sp.]|nr:MAG: hypothetical protein C0623_06415 [Desulfuromonas sp.]